MSESSDGSPDSPELRLACENISSLANQWTYCGSDCPGARRRCCRKLSCAIRASAEVARRILEVAWLARACPSSNLTLSTFVENCLSGWAARRLARGGAAYRFPGRMSAVGRSAPSPPVVLLVAPWFASPSGVDGVFRGECFLPLRPWFAVTAP